MKNRINDLKNEFFKEVIKLIFMIIIYFFYNKNLYTNSDFITAIRDSLVIIIPYIIYIFLISIGGLIIRPIRIIVKMSNSSLNEDDDDIEKTILYHDGMSREDARTVKLSLKVKDNWCVWSHIARKFLKDKKVILKVSIQPYTDKFVCQPSSFDERIDFCGSCFTIDVTDIIFNNLDDRIPTDMICYFIINENRDNPSGVDCKCYIKPYILVNDNKINFFHRCFIKYKLDMKKGMYSINFRK